MKKYFAALEQPNILSRFKVYESRHHLHPKVYRNRGVLKDAERFSLVDTVLDGEYNDYEIIEKKYRRSKELPGVVLVMRDFLDHSYRQICGFLFRTLLMLRLCIYYIFHFRYKAR